MKISSIVDIIDGKLLNSPSISYIHSIKTNPKRVKQSDLFIAINKNDIELAITNGAFATIFEGDFDLIDNETAYIKVDNLELAMIKLIRFKLSTVNFKAFYTSNATFDLLKIYQNSSSNQIFFLSKDVEKVFRFLDDIDNESILVSKNSSLLGKIAPNFSSFEKNIKNSDIKNLIEHSLFETSFSYKEIFFSRVKISSLYIKNLINTYLFLKSDFDFSKLKNFPNLRAIFLDKNLEPIEFGKSNRFIICQENIELVKDEISYINSNYNYAKSIFISKDREFATKKEFFIANNLDKLKDILNNETFNCAYLIGFSYNEVLEYLQNCKTQSALF